MKQLIPGVDCVNYSDYFRKSRQYFEKQEELILLVRAGRNIGKTTFMFDLIEECLERGNNFILCRGDVESTKEVIANFNQKFENRYHVATDGRVYKLQAPTLQNKFKPSQFKVDGEKVYGLICGFSRLDKFRSQISIQDLETFIYDEYNLEQIAVENFYKTFFQFITTFIRETTKLKHFWFIGNRDGGNDNDIENALNFHFKNDGKEEILETTLPAKIINSYLPWYDKGDVKIAKGWNLGNFNIADRIGKDSEVKLTALALLNAGTRRYYLDNMNMDSNKERKLINVWLSGMYKEWKPICNVYLFDTIQAKVGIMIAKWKNKLVIQYSRDWEFDIPSVSLDWGAVSGGEKLNDKDKEDVIKNLLEFEKNNAILYDDKFLVLFLGKVLNRYRISQDWQTI